VGRHYIGNANQQIEERPQQNLVVDK